jgi:DNA (cytosine-5)-methyltransferase 1
VFELRTPAHRITDSEFSSSPIQLFGTLTTEPSVRSDAFRGNGTNPAEFVADLLRTPTASQGEGGALGEEEARKRGNTVGIRDQAMDLANANGEKVSRAEMLPTPMTSDARHNNNQGSWNRKSPQIGTVVHSTNWGKFELAIRRWEETIGRPAPAPTKPDGKDGAHRLSAEFTEWMMGVPAGWIVDVGLTRNEALKACGNGVVPQQAALALRVLLEGITLPSGGGA